LNTPLICQAPASLQRSAHERREEFDNLLSPHLNSLSRLVRARAKDWSEADDVVQEALFRAFRHLDQLRDKAYFKPWLFSIAINEIRQKRRSEGHSPVLALDGSNERPKIADMRRSPHTECERAELSVLLREALSKLPEKYRSVVELRDLADLSVLETAQRLRLGVSTTKTRHLRARAMLLKAVRQLVARRSRAKELERDCRCIATIGRKC
jgi:RNA polymerase sigma-70 factor (ECF subfamily)